VVDLELVVLSCVAAGLAAVGIEVARSLVEFLAEGGDPL
jgi:hypothetical protein